MEQLVIHFGDPEYGWIEVSITNGDEILTIDVDSKSNSFFGLVKALDGLFEEDGRFEVYWMEEPGTITWIFSREQNRFTFHASHSEGPPYLMCAMGSYQEICVPFINALQALVERFTPDELLRRVEDLFPFQELQALKKHIR
jgi:hypothetical protein